MRGVPAKEPSFIQRNVQKNVVFFICFFIDLIDQEDTLSFLLLL